MNLRILLLRTKKSSDFLRWGPSLSHSIMVDGKKEFLKKLCFIFFVFYKKFLQGILWIFRVEYNEHLVGIKLNRYLGFSFSKTLQKSKAFYTSVEFEASTNLFKINLIVQKTKGGNSVVIVRSKIWKVRLEIGILNT